MNGYEYILAKQTALAVNANIDLISSNGLRGRRAYTPQLNQNLFQPLLTDVRDSFATGDGDELGSTDLLGKMQAVHSSSALAVNVFQYWKEHNDVPIIAAQCGLCRPGSQVSCDLRFEEKYPISDNFKYHPNIDVVIHNSSSSQFKRFAIECKFSEAYNSRKNNGMDEKYLDLNNLWKDIPNLRSFAESISPEDSNFIHLNPAQLVKHILGLKRKFGRKGFRLLYLWYDVFGEQGVRHSNEIQYFAEISKKDGIKFHALTYQKLIMNLSKKLRSEHSKYVEYLTNRYI